MSSYEHLTQLGSTTVAPVSPDDAQLEVVPAPEGPFVVRFVCPEFTTLCPVTGQPDFAHLVIDYVPDQLLVESKSLKLFLHAFRNCRDFHEASTLKVADRIHQVTQCRWLRIGGYWYPRGGIPIDVFYQVGTLPEGVWVPDQGVAPYRGRG
jgi:7-cyano-7-deazaguanine reductase